MSPKSPRERTILCLDLDAFFVSVERLLRPALCDRPVVVGGDGARGVVAAASYEARRYGVRSAMPIGEAHRRLAGAKDAVFVPPSHGLYELHSGRVRRLLDEELPLVQAASIDEFYADATGLAGEIVARAERIASRVHRECGLPVSIGIATSKLVAKIVTDDAKPRGILRVLPGHEAAYLGALPIERVPGVGPKTAPRLHAVGVREIGDVARLGASALADAIGKSMAEWLIETAAGRDPAPVEEREEARTIGHEETYESDLSTIEAILSAASDLSERVAFRLRREGLRARTVQVKLRYSARRVGYQEGRLARETYETLTRARTGDATDDGLEIAERARTLLRENWRSGEPVRLLGVSASHLAAPGEEPRQGTLFEAAATEDPRVQRLNAAMDDLRGRFGFESVGRASQRRPPE